MKKRNFFLIIIACWLLQATILNSFRFFWVKPDLLLVCAVIAGIKFDLKWALIFSLSCGLLKDCLGPQVFGFNTALFPLWSMLIVRLGRQVTFDTFYIRVAIVAIVVLAQNILVGLALIYLGESVPLGIFTRIVFIECLYATACYLPLDRMIR
jgi:rod shape-determining protein MreD